MNVFYIPSAMINGHEYETTFHMDFDIADHYGLDAIKDTFKRAFDEWKTDIKYITELAVVVNLRSWYWYEKGNNEFSQLYAKYYYKVRNYVYSDKSNFSKEDQHYYFEITD